MTKTKAKDQRKDVGMRWISFRLPDGMRADLDKIARKESRTMSSIIRVALSGFIVNYAKTKARG